MSMQILSQRFSRLSEVASTNFSSVYQAIDSVGKHPVALKVAAGVGGRLEDVLKREFNFLSSCAHPNIVEAFDYGTDEEGRPFYTMKWIPGATIFDAASRPQIVSSEVIPGLCRALAEIHGAGFVYGDLNPSNVLVTKKNGGLNSTLIDFGLVSKIGTSFPGELRGTPDYMAPEIHRGDPLTPATDIYSFGVLLRHLLEDQQGEKRLDLSHAICTEPLRELIQQCLKYYPDLRPHDFRQIEELWCREIARTKSTSIGLTVPSIKSRKLFGRDDDMRRLQRHCVDLLNRGGGIILVNGIDGVGKTALIREHCQLAQLQGCATLRIICDDVTSKVDVILEAIDTWIAGSQSRGELANKGLYIYLQTAGLFDARNDSVSRIIAKISGHRIACIVECGRVDRRLPREDVVDMRLRPLSLDQFGKFLCAAFETDPLVPALTKYLYEASKGIPGLIAAKRLEYVEYLRGGGKPEAFAWRKPPQQLVRQLRILFDQFTMTENQVFLAIGKMRGEFSLADVIAQTGADRPVVEAVLDSLVERDYLRFSGNGGNRAYVIGGLWTGTAIRMLARKVSGTGIAADDTVADGGSLQKPSRRSLVSPQSAAEVEEWVPQYGLVKNLPETVIAARGICRSQKPWLDISSTAKRAILHHTVQNYESVGDFGKARQWVLRMTELFDLDCMGTGRLSYDAVNETVQILNRFCTPQQRASWITRMLAAYPDIDPAIRALLLSEMGVIEYFRQDYEKALARYFEAEALCSNLDMEYGPRTRNLNRIGTLYAIRRQQSTALKYYKMAEREAQKGDDQEIKAAIKVNIGIALIDQGLTVKARPFLLAGQTFARRAHHLRMLAMVSRNLTLCQADLAPATQAVRSADEALAMAARIGDVSFRALGLSNLGWTYLRAGNVRDAYTNIMSAIAVARESDNLKVLSLAYLNLGRLSHLQGRRQESVHHAIQSYRSAVRQKSPRGAAEALREIAKYFMTMGRLNRTRRFLQSSLEVGDAQPGLRDRFFIDAVTAELDIRERSLDTARRRLESWESGKHGDLLPGWLCTLNRVRGILELAAGNHETAAKYLRDAACRARAFERYDLLLPIYEDLVECYEQAANARIGVAYLVELNRLYQKVGRMDQNNRLEAAIQSLMERPFDADTANMLFKLSESLTRFSDKRQLLDYLLNLAVHYFGADRGALISKHPVSNKWFIEAQHGLETDLDRADAVEISKSVVRKVSETARFLKIDNAVDDPSTRKRKSIILNNIQSVLCVPVLIGANVWGVLYLDNRSVPGAFIRTDVLILQALANFMALAIEQTDEMERLRLPDSAAHTAENADLPFIAVSQKMRSLLSIVDKIADSEVSVMILGENGTGKDMLARYIHQKSGRRSQPFVTMNCAGLVEPLADSELFGIENNVATGVKFREGKFKLADRGTLFLNEIGDLPMAIQSKLLQALQDGIIERVGGSPMPVDVRFIAATNKNLDEMVRAKEFRQDLFYRINSVTMVVPPLAERVDDIPALAKSFLEYFCRKYGRNILELTEKNFEEFAMYSWPGNVRELKGLIERGVLLAEGRTFPLGLTRPSSRRTAHGKSERRKLDSVLKQTERECIVEALSGAGWNQSKAANWLGLRESTLRSKIQRLGIEKPRKL